MKKTILKGKGILAVNNERNILVFLADEAENYGVILDLARSCREAMQKMACLSYDLAILDAMDAGCLDLLALAVGNDIPVVMLTAHTMTPEALHQSIEIGARAFLSKRRLGQIMPFLEDVFTLSSRPLWRKNFEMVAGYFGKTYGSGWCRAESNFWNRGEEDLGSENFAIILE